MYVADTIAAIATAPGLAGIGILRISGPQTGTVLGAIFRGALSPAQWISHRLYHGVVLDSSGLEVDQGLAVWMRSPHSYTGEEVAEVHCHGSPVILQQALRSALVAGARLAEAGEFTKRAFLNGRLDLTQAEAVLDAIQARTPQAARLAQQQLSGFLSDAVEGLRSQVIRLKALLEAQIDFSEEDFHIDPRELLQQVDVVEEPLRLLLATYKQGRVVREGVRVAIVGRPNVGKSSLLNALLGQDRAIVTPIAGTTRDTLEESIHLSGILVVITDTAGLREEAEADTVELLGIQRTLASLEEAEVVLVVVDASRSLSEEDRAVLRRTAGRRRLLVANKADQPQQIDLHALGLDAGATILVSAKTGAGLQDLRDAIASAVGELPVDPDSPVITRARHEVALRSALQSLALARQSITEGQPCDLVAVDVQDCLDHLGSVTGLVTNEEVLDHIFKEFCIGK